MKEEEPNWFSRSWDDDLPPPEDLTPLSQSLITPDLALAFDIPTSTPPPPQPHHDHTSSGDDQARTLKRPRLVWTPQLHKRFVDAVAHLGIKNAVPKTIMQLMSVDGLTRENVASHLQKYRLYLKRMQSLSAGPVAHSDLAIDKLFAAGPVPHSFIGRGTEQFPSFGQGIQPPQHQMVAAVHHPQFFRGPGGFVPPSGGGMQRLVGVGIGGRFAEEVETGASGRKVLTLFPTNDG